MIAKSTVYSVGVALAYGTIATTYILVSTALAADSSASVEELRRIETIKGVLFVAATTLAVFAGALLAMRRMEQDSQELVRRECALVANEGKVFAGIMAASVAHDANNVLIGVLADLEALAAATPHDDGHSVQRLRNSVDRLVALNRRLLGAAKSGLPRDRTVVDLPRLVRDSVASVRSHALLRNCRVVCKGDPSFEIDSQPLLVHQIVSNLLLNAAEATNGRGTIEVVVQQVYGGVMIAVHDDGPGVPPHRWADLFDALETTKPHGTGLGLFSVRACAQSLGGTASVGRSPLGGAVFEIRLPAEVRHAVA